MLCRNAGCQDAGYLIINIRRENSCESGDVFPRWKSRLGYSDINLREVWIVRSLIGYQIFHLSQIMLEAADQLWVYFTSNYEWKCLTEPFGCSDCDLYNILVFPLWRLTFIFSSAVVPAQAPPFSAAPLDFGAHLASGNVDLPWSFEDATRRTLTHRVSVLSFPSQNAVWRLCFGTRHDFNKIPPIHLCRAN